MELKADNELAKKAMWFGLRIQYPFKNKSRGYCMLSRLAQLADLSRVRDCPPQGHYNVWCPNILIHLDGPSEGNEGTGSNDCSKINSYFYLWKSGEILRPDSTVYKEKWKIVFDASWVVSVTKHITSWLYSKLTGFK